MKKISRLKEYQQRVMDNGVAHLVYHQSGVENIIHPYSIEGYELLSDEFLSFLEKYRPIIPPGVPIALEIVGNPLTAEEKELVDSTIWNHFRLSMTKNDREIKSILKKSAFYLLFTILSTALLFAVSSVLDEVVSNLAYMPFYFFGYRLLIYLLIDCLPTWKQRNWYRRLASLKLIFSGQESRSFHEEDLSRISEEFIQYEKEAEADMRGNKMLNEYLLEKGTAILACKVSSIDDVIRIPALKGREYMSDALSAYLQQAEPFITGSNPVSLHIIGPQFREDDKNSILAAIKNYYSVRMATEEDDSIVNMKMILVFGLFTAFSALVLACCGSLVNLALHEFIVMLFWFFGDYLLEFLLITHPEIQETMKILNNCRDMTVVFEHSDS